MTAPALPPYPQQQMRTVDPYSEYNSNVVNRLTRIVTTKTFGGTNTENVIRSYHSVEVVKASNTTVTLYPGMVIKDDVIIEVGKDPQTQVSSSMTVDLTNPAYYPIDNIPFNEVGTYIFAFSYSYVKARPAPQLSIIIFKPSQFALFNSGYIFIKALNVSFNGLTFQLDTVQNYHPTSPYPQREYPYTFAGVFEKNLPSYGSLEHESMIVYCPLPEDYNRLVYGAGAAGTGNNEGFQSLSVVNTSIITAGLWVFDSGLYRYDYLLTGPMKTNPYLLPNISFYNYTTKAQLIPYKVERIVGDVLRIWMPINTIDVYFIITG
jgi:hypothetical protein